jgi:hypothetical protein
VNYASSREKADHVVARIAANLRASQAGIDDRTGKGMATELVVEKELLRPFLPPGLRLWEGAVVSTDSPTQQSGAIDRVIYSRVCPRNQTWPRPPLPGWGVMPVREPFTRPAYNNEHVR